MASPTRSGKRPPLDTLDATPPAASERILTLLQLNRVAIADQLAHSVSSLRPAQTAQLLVLLDALQDVGALDAVAAHFDRKLDVKDEMERYLHDVLKMHHYITHHEVDAKLASAMVQLYGAFGDGSDRLLLAKVFRTLGFGLSSVFCTLCGSLPLKYQQELLTLFADELPELRAWVRWLAKVRGKDTSSTENESSEGFESTPFGDAVQFIVKTVLERCTLSWLAQLRPLPHEMRLSVMRDVHKRLSSTTLKQLVRFYETSGVPLRSYLGLDPTVRLHLSTLLDEFPTATLQTLLAKFNSAALVRSILAGLKLLPKRELLRLVDALGIADNTTVDTFARAFFAYKRLQLFASLFLSFSATQTQLHFLELLVLVMRTTELPQSLDQSGDEGASTTAPRVTPSPDARDDGETQSEPDPTSAWLVFDLFLDAHFDSYDVVIQKLVTLPSTHAREFIVSIARYTPEELSVVGEGIESVSSGCLVQFLTAFAKLPPESRRLLVKWVREMPGDEALPIYDVLLAHLQAAAPDVAGGSDAAVGSSGSELAIKILDLISSLSTKDKRTLCTAILVHTMSPSSRDNSRLGGAPPSLPPSLQEASDPDVTARELNDSVLRYLCDCALATHKAIKLFRIIPEAKYAGLVFLLRTQRLAEQVALSRLMLSLPAEANCRLLDKVQSLVPTDTLDLFFELLLLIPQVEYRLFTKLLVSPNVSPDHLRIFIEVAASLMNQASSRELVIFTAELPVLTRNLFFEMLASDPVKGVLLRIVACSSKLPPELLYETIALLHPLSWATRSSLVEQIRALEDSQDVQDLANVAHDLDPDDLQTLVLLFNLLQVPVRIAFIALFTLLSRHEKHLALAKLNALPKAVFQANCCEVCDSRRPSAVGLAFFRMLGLLDSAYQSTLLQLVQIESSWPLLSLMADCVAQNAEANLLNGFAASLVLLTRETEFLVLRSVVESALAGDTTLSELVVVLCHFRTPETLLEFLKFAQHLSRFTRPAVLFRVLSKYKQTVFIYSMCRMLDLDDALFALKRLDRLWQRHHEVLDSELESLSARLETEGVKIKAAFCNAVLGFRERGVSVSDDHARLQSSKPRLIVPRAAQASGAHESLSSPGAPEDDSDEDNSFRHVLFIPSTRSLTQPPLSLERLLQRTRSEDAFAQRPAASDTATLEISTLSISSSCEPSPDSSGNNSTANTTVSSVFALTESAVTLPRIPPVALVADPDIEDKSWRARECVADAEIDTSRSTTQQTRTELPLLVASQQCVPTVRLTDSPRPSSGDQAKRTTESIPSPTAAAHCSDRLRRSESAPTTFEPILGFPSSQRPRRYRGLAAALDVPSDFHVGRDRGAIIFRKECEAVEARGPSRIRVSKSLAAQTRIMEVRVQQALGTRDARHNAQLVSPLVRPDRHTFEQASAALTLAARAREVDTKAFCHPMR